MKKTIFLLALSVVLILAASAQSALAYFTTYAEAKGGYIPQLGGTDIEEQFSNWTKRVTVSNSENGQPVYVRARAYAGDQYTLTYGGEGWTLGSDGYYYYDKILYGGEDTTELLVQINNIPEEAIPGDQFNVVVIYETTPVQWDDSGLPCADWGQTIEGGN